MHTMLFTLGTAMQCYTMLPAANGLPRGMPPIKIDSFLPVYNVASGKRTTEGDAADQN